MDVKHFRSLDICQSPSLYLRNKAYPAHDVTDLILADGVFVSVGHDPVLGIDAHLVLPPRQPFGPGDAARYEVHRYSRVISENAPGAVKNFFAIVDNPKFLSWNTAPWVHKACVFLYNYFKRVDGFVAEHRYDWLN